MQKGVCQRLMMSYSSVGSWELSDLFLVDNVLIKTPLPPVQYRFISFKHCWKYLVYCYFTAQVWSLKFNVEMSKC